jgi:hypothetical protein
MKKHTIAYLVTTLIGFWVIFLTIVRGVHKNIEWETIAIFDTLLLVLFQILAFVVWRIIKEYDNL